MEFFNKEDVYDNEIAPLMKDIIDICKKHEIPMLCSFTYENCEDNGVGTCDTIVGNDGNRHNEKLTSALREIRKTNGFVTAITISK